MSKNHEKILTVMAKCTQLLFENQCSYIESFEIIDSVVSELKQQQENLEYNEIKDYFEGNKCCCVDNQVITPLRDFEELPPQFFNQFLKML